MKVLVVYNRYRHRVHGEEFVVENTTKLLRERGVDVSHFTRSSEGLQHSAMQQVGAALAGIYNPYSRAAMAAELRSHRFDVVHLHNIYPWISPSVISAARAAGVPIVMTVHHYGLSCPILTHFRDGAPCTLCASGSSIHAVLNNCRQSTAQSLVYATRAAVARRMRWFTHDVTLLIALSEFARAQLIRAGFAADRIVVRPNMVNMTANAPVREAGAGSYAAYVGRISYEKGVDLLCDATESAGIPLRIAGDCSDWPAARRQSPHVRYEGVLQGAALDAFYRGARFIVVPSRWWEVCPLVVLEAMNLGVPVIAARVGGLPELVVDQVNGLLFTPGDLPDLTSKMLHLWNNPGDRERFAQAAHIRVCEKYSAAPYVDDLLSIYSEAMQRVVRATR
jgi:glycosyltransferase involved in cell wall biosynthesis